MEAGIERSLFSREYSFYIAHTSRGHFRQMGREVNGKHYH